MHPVRSAAEDSDHFVSDSERKKKHTETSCLHVQFGLQGQLGSNSNPDQQ